MGAMGLAPPLAKPGLTFEGRRRRSPIKSPFGVLYDWFPNGDSGKPDGIPGRDCNCNFNPTEYSCRPFR